jgi:hypothetical protein
VTVHAARPITSQDKSRELQRKLYLAAKRNRNRRFHALYVRLFPPGYDRIFRPDILRQAWEEVRRNGGSAGEDGVRNVTEIGSPQGGVISPLLANIYLHVLDM